MPFYPSHRYLYPEEVRRSLRRLYHNFPPLQPPRSSLQTPYSIVTPLTTTLGCASPIFLPLSVPYLELLQDTLQVHCRKPQACPRHHIPLPLSV